MSPATLLPLPRESGPCPYLAGRAARFEHYVMLEADDDGFCAMLESGFRHFGRYWFRPACPGAAGGGVCGACLPLRIPVAAFRPSKSQRRVARRAAALAMTCGEPRASDEKYAIYCRHLARFEPVGAAAGAAAAAAAAVPPTPSREGFEQSFYEALPWTRECEYRLDGRLVAVSLIDLAPRAMSAIYCYFDPDAAEFSPGTASALRELELALALRIPYYYLGYTMAANRSLRYKAEFRPSEARVDGQWRPLRAVDGRWLEPFETLRTTADDFLVR